MTTDDDHHHEIGNTQRYARDRCRKQLCRNIATALVHGMAITHTDICLIAIRIGSSEVEIRRLINRLIDGNAISLNQVSDLFFAMGLELQISLTERKISVVPSEIPFEPRAEPKIEEEPSGDDTATAEDSAHA